MGIKIGHWRIGGGEKAISLLVACSLAYYPLTYALNEVVNRYIQHGAWWDSALCTFIYMIIVFMAIPLVVRRQTRFSVGAFFVAIVVFLATILSGSDGATYASKNFLTFFTTSFSFLLVGLAIRDFDEMDKLVDHFTCIIIVAAVVWIAIIVFNVNRGLRVAYMSISYYVLPSCLLRTYYYFRDKSIKNLIWMVVGILSHIIWGTRGPILFAFAFLALCIVWNNRNRKGISIAILLLIAIIIIYQNFLSILRWANSLFLSMGLQNGGIIKLLTEEDLTDGRIDLIKQMLPYIDDHFVLGGGIYCDRSILGGYVHLIPVEFICDFGVIIGTVAFLYLLGAIVKVSTLLRDFSSFKWAIFWVSVVVGFVKLFLSGSYLEEPYFYFLLGLMANKSLYLQETEYEGSHS